MDVKQTLLRVLIAALSVIGFWGILHGLLEALLVPRELATAVIITHAVSPEELDILLCEARRASFGRGKRVVLVLAPMLLQGGLGENGHLFEEYAEITEKYGASICLADDGLHP